MHISSLIRSPSWLYYKLWTQNNLFHASFSRQRKRHQFHLCMPTTVKAAGAELPNSQILFSAGPCDCPEPCPGPSLQSARAKSVCAIPVPHPTWPWIFGFLGNVHSDTSCKPGGQIPIFCSVLLMQLVAGSNCMLVPNNWGSCMQNTLCKTGKSCRCPKLLKIWVSHSGSYLDIGGKYHEINFCAQFTPCDTCRHFKG